MDQQLIQLIAKVNKQLELRLAQRLKQDLELTFTDFEILSIIYQLAGNSNAQVAQEAIVKSSAVDKSTVTRRLQSCYQHKLIRRAVDKNSAREKNVILTEQGLELIQAAIAIQHTLYNQVMSRLDPYAQKQLQIYLLSIQNALPQ